MIPETANRLVSEMKCFVRVKEEEEVLTGVVLYIYRTESALVFNVSSLFVLHSICVFTEVRWVLFDVRVHRDVAAVNQWPDSLFDIQEQMGALIMTRWTNTDLHIHHLNS